MKILEFLFNLFVCVFVGLTALDTINHFYKLNVFESVSLVYITSQLITALNNIKLRYMSDD